MKKRLLISMITIVAAIIVTFSIIFIIPSKKQKLSIVNYNGTILDLGEYNVNGYKKEMYANEKEKISFYVKDKRKFYNDIIKQNAFYDYKLDYNSDKYFAYGFIYKDNSLFRYIVGDDNYIEIESYYGSIYILDEKTNQKEDCIVPGPFNLYMSSDELEVIDYSLNYDQFVQMILLFTNDYYDYDLDKIHLKGYKRDGCITSKYLITIYNHNNEIKVGLYNE